MRLDDLVSFSDREVHLGVVDWAMAQLFAQARTRSNERRSPKADRGGKGNADADLIGCMAELLLLDWVVKTQGTASSEAGYMCDHLFVAGGGRGVEGPDLFWTEDGQGHAVDMKSFDCAPNKRYFAINAKKHDDLHSWHASYVGLLAPLGGRTGVLSRVVPHDEVGGWELRSLRSSGSPSRNLHMQSFKSRFVDPSSQDVVCRVDCVLPAEVNLAAAARGSGSAHANLVGLLPQIEAYLPS